MHLYNFFVYGPKFTRFLLSNVGGVVVGQLLFSFSTCRPLPEIFAISLKLSELAPKFGRFLPSQLLGGGPSESYTHVITPALSHVAWQSFMKILTLAPKL